MRDWKVVDVNHRAPDIYRPSKNNKKGTRAGVMTGQCLFCVDVGEPTPQSYRDWLETFDHHPQTNTRAPAIVFLSETVLDLLNPRNPGRVCRLMTLHLV